MLLQASFRPYYYVRLRGLFCKNEILKQHNFSLGGRMSELIARAKKRPFWLFTFSKFFLACFVKCTWNYEMHVILLRLSFFYILSDGTHDLPYLYFMGVKYFLTITHNLRSVKYLLYFVNWKVMISREVPLNCEEGCMLLHFEFAMLIFYQFDVFYSVLFLNNPLKMLDDTQYSIEKCL